MSCPSKNLCVRCQVHRAPGVLAATLLLKGIVSSVQKAVWRLEEGADMTVSVGPQARKVNSWDNRRELGGSGDLRLEVVRGTEKSL